jgi:hypothetical protein
MTDRATFLIFDEWGPVPDRVWTNTLFSINTGPGKFGTAYVSTARVWPDKFSGCPDLWRTNGRVEGLAKSSREEVARITRLAWARAPMG